MDSGGVECAEFSRSKAFEGLDLGGGDREVCTLNWGLGVPNLEGEEASGDGDIR